MITEVFVSVKEIHCGDPLLILSGVFPSLSRAVPVTPWSTGLRTNKPHHRRLEPENSTGDLRQLQEQGAEVLTIEGQVGQRLSAVPDQTLRAYL